MPPWSSLNSLVHAEQRGKTAATCSKTWGLCQCSLCHHRPLPFLKLFSYIKKIGGKTNYTKALHKKVINANSSEKIAPTDGINPFPANASGCADGNYRMYVNMGAPGSTATRTAEPGRSGNACPGPSPALGKEKTRFGKGLGCVPSALQLQLLKPTPYLAVCLSTGIRPWPGGHIGRGSGHSRGVSGLIPAHSGQENSQAPAQHGLGVLVALPIPEPHCHCSSAQCKH